MSNLPYSVDNQCDGCRQRLPKVAGDIHISKDGTPFMVCTAKRYNYTPPPCIPSLDAIEDNKIIVRGILLVVQSFLKDGCILSRLRNESTWHLSYHPYFDFGKYDYKPKGDY